MFITDATETDIPGIQALAEVTFRREYAADHDAACVTRFLNRVYSVASLKRAIQSEGATFLVAREGDTIIGIGNFGSPLFDDCKERKEIFRLFVHPDFCRRGIGGQFIAQTIRRLQLAGGITECVVYVKNTDAIRLNFYRKYQFRHLPERDKADEWCLVRDIQPGSG